MHFRVLFPSNYIAAHELNGKDAVLTIRRVVVEDLKTERGTERKPVVYFEELFKKSQATNTEEKRMVMNKTNAKAIAGMYGPEVNDWAGKRISLYSAIVDAFGKSTDAIRVRPVPPPAATPAATVAPAPASPAETK